MKITPKKSGAAEFLRAYKDSIEETLVFEKADRSRLVNLRCSQLPYCPGGVLTQHVQYGKVRPMRMLMAYYVSVGSAVHSVMQRFLPHSGKFLADYTCRICKKKWPLSHKWECCEAATTYDEVEIDVEFKRGRIKGHIDAIFRTANGRYWIVDFKTASVAGAKNKVKKVPPGYRRQVRAYAYLLDKQYDIRVEGVMLVYIPRDNPLKPEVWEHRMTEDDFVKAKKELLADLKLHYRTMRASTKEEIMDLIQVDCKGEYCEACKKTAKEKWKIIKKGIKALPILQ